MQQTTFSPAAQVSTDEDKVSGLLLTAAQNVLVAVCGLSPLLFLPTAFIPLGYSKALILIFGLAIALVLFSFSVLRNGSVSLRLLIGPLAFLAVVCTAFISALLSGDVRDALYGDFMDPHAVAFIALLGVIMASIGILRTSKVSIIRMYVLLMVSALVLCVFHVGRLLLGADVATFGIFVSDTASPLDGWNSLALFFGLTLLIGLVAVEQLPLTKIGKGLLAFVALCSLIVLSVVNFFAIWVVLAIVSLAVLVYGLSKNRFGGRQLSIEHEEHNSFVSIIFAALVFVVSSIFIVGGSSLGAVVSETTGISHVEVRPSSSATLDIARETLKDSPIYGIGPNKFVDAWRLHKNPAINQTVFWNNNFQSGNSYITTAFVETGLLGIVAWTIFLLVLFVQGLRMVFRSQPGDRFWYFIGTSSLVASLYLWTMSIVYVPSSTILILAAVCSGVFFTAYSVLAPTKSLELSIATNRNIGFVLVAGVIFLIVASMSTAYFVSQHYIATHQFSKAIATVTPGDTLESLERQIAAAYEKNNSDLFARQLAAYQSAQLSSLLTVTNPTEVEQDAFSAALEKGVVAAQTAVTSDQTEPLNHQILGQIYSAAAFANIEGAYDRAKQAFQKAQELDPVNPVLPLLEAQLESRQNNLAVSRDLAERAIQLRPQYTEALFLLSQIDIAEGKTAEAIERTRSIISLEPQNPARRYQLGILHSSNGDLDAAVLAFEEAVSLNPSYANARYFLALGYVDQQRIEDAIEQLRIVQNLNPQNANVGLLIEQLESGSPIQNVAAGVPVDESSATFDATSTDFESNVVSPVNTIPDRTVDTPAETAEEDDETAPEDRTTTEDE